MALSFVVTPMIRRVCSTCNGRGYTYSAVAALLDPRTWIPFNWNARPMTRCTACGGQGSWISKEWRRSPGGRRG